MQKNEFTLALAESCTGGMVAKHITDVPGSSSFFLEAAVTYSNDAKIDILEVDKKTIIECGAVHEQTAIEMAAGARKKAHADFGLSTTGIAGPSGGTPEKPVGMVCVGLSGPLGSDAKTYTFTSGDRQMNKEMFAAVAINRLRKHLIVESID